MSDNLRIAVYAIAKDEEAFTNRFLESAHDADLILVADTGSSDTTPIRVRHYREQWHPRTELIRVHVQPWRFDVARNAVLAHLPPDIDVCIALDMDEVLVRGWREEVAKAWVPGTTRLRYGYDWGNGVVFMAEKIHARNGYHWRNPVHEYPMPDARMEEVYGEVPSVLIQHLPNPLKPRTQYLELLELGYREDPTCHRNLLYYARELAFHKMWDQAEQALYTYLVHPLATWEAERSFAMGLLATVFLNKDDPGTALKWFQRATAETPYMREPWVAMAWHHHDMKRWESCYAAVHEALKITEPPKVYFTNPSAWSALPYDLLSVSAWHLGLYEEALDAVTEALRLDPENPRLKENLKLFLEETS